MKKVLVVLVACAWLASGRFSAPLQAQSNGPKFEIDPSWPKPLPEGWIIGRTGSTCVDAHDHLIVTNRRDITAEEAETSKQAPSILIFDLAGNLVESGAEANAVYAVALEKRHDWLAGELAYWRWRAGARDAPPDWIAEPFRLHIAGNLHDAAAAWQLGRLLLLVADLSRLPAPGERRRPRWLQCVEDAIEAAGAEPPSVADLAALAGVHASHLLRTFRRHM